MHAAATACVLALVMLGGCIGSLGMCPTHFPNATWHEPDLYGKLAAHGTVAAGGPALPFDRPDLAGNLTSVSWRGFPHSLSSAFDSIELQAAPGGPVASVLADEGTPVARIEAAFRAFLERVTGASTAEVQAWSATGARQSTWADIIAYPDGAAVRIMEFHVRVPGPFRLEDIYYETGAHLPTQSLSVGQEWHKGANWHFRFDFAQVNVGLPGGVDVTADSRDVVKAEVPGEPTTTNSSLAQIQHGFRSIGIDITGPQPAEFTTAQC